MFQTRFSLAAVVLCLSTWTSPAAAESPLAAPHDYEADVREIIELRCGMCHGSESQAAGVSFVELRDARIALQKRPLWKRALRRIAAGEMPPEDAPPLTGDEKRRLTEWLDFAVQ